MNGFFEMKHNLAGDKTIQKVFWASTIYELKLVKGILHESTARIIRIGHEINVAQLLKRSQIGTVLRACDITAEDERPKK